MKSRLKYDIEIKVDTDIYPLEAVQYAAYLFMEGRHVKIDKTDEANIVSVKIRDVAKNNFSEEEFFNELLHYSLRVRISEHNRVIRERIVLQALSSALRHPEKKSMPQNKPEAPSSADVVLEQEIEKLLKEAESGSYKNDPLNIAIPWEESASDSGSKKEVSIKDLPGKKTKKSSSR